MIAWSMRACMAWASAAATTWVASPFDRVSDAGRLFGRLAGRVEGLPDVLDEGSHERAGHGDSPACGNPPGRTR